MFRYSLVSEYNEYWVRREGGRVRVTRDAGADAEEVPQTTGRRFNSIKKGTEKRPEKGTESQFAKNICMNFLDWVELQ